MLGKVIWMKKASYVLLLKIWAINLKQIAPRLCVGQSVGLFAYKSVLLLLFFIVISPPCSLLPKQQGV